MSRVDSTPTHYLKIIDHDRVLGYLPWWYFTFDLFRSALMRQINNWVIYTLYFYDWVCCVCVCVGGGGIVLQWSGRISVWRGRISVQWVWVKTLFTQDFKLCMCNVLFLFVQLTDKDFETVEVVLCAHVILTTSLCRKFE